MDRWPDQAERRGETVYHKLARMWFIPGSDPRRWVPDPHFGKPGVRDSEGPCDAFEPVVRKRVLGVVQPSWGDCHTDGHYLCDECLHRTTPEQRAATTGYPAKEFDIP